MTSPFRLNPIKTAAIDAAALAAASPATFAAARPEISKVVDLEATTTKATIVRGTESVETPAINNRKSVV